jgi:hypothetical protein
LSPFYSAPTEITHSDLVRWDFFLYAIPVGERDRGRIAFGGKGHQVGEQKSIAHGSDIGTQMPASIAQLV